MGNDIYIHLSWENEVEEETLFFKSNTLEEARDMLNWIKTTIGTTPMVDTDNKLEIEFINDERGLINAKFVIK